MKKTKVHMKSILADYWRHTKRHPFLLTFVILGILVVQGATVAAPIFLKDFLDLIAEGAPQDPEIMRGLFAALWLFGLFTFVAWGSRRLFHFALYTLETKVMAEVDKASFTHLIRHSYHFFISHFAGSLVRRVARYRKSYEIVADAFALQILPALLQALGIIAVLYYRNMWLGIALAVWVFIFLSVQFFLVRWLQPLRLEAARQDSLVTGVLADAVGNQPTITSFSTHKHEERMFGRVVETLRQSIFRSWMWDDAVWAIQGFLAALINIVLLWGALLLWREGLVTVGDFGLIQIYLLTMFERLTHLGRDLRHFFSGLADAAEMREILDLPHEIRDKPDAVPLIVHKGEIRFNNVHFQYRDGNPILSNFNLRVAGGEKIAFVGPSGAGKTTVTKLLLRLYDVNEGRVEIDGQNITGITLESLRKAIAFVPQDPLLFHRTLLENIRYGKLDASEAEIIEAAKKAHCHEFISGLPKGYETLVGERGIKLSGGERQRIAIARAILKNAPILILDEATSSLDSESESLIQDALEILMKGKTVIVIAHRLSTIIKMNRIIVIEEGRVTAEGRHEELVARGGRYQTLWNIQAGGFLDLDKNEREDG